MKTNLTILLKSISQHVITVFLWIKNITQLLNKMVKCPFLKERNIPKEHRPVTYIYVWLHTCLACVYRVVGRPMSYGHFGQCLSRYT